MKWLEKSDTSVLTYEILLPVHTIDEEITGGGFVNWIAMGFELSFIGNPV